MYICLHAAAARPAWRLGGAVNGVVLPLLALTPVHRNSIDAMARFIQAVGKALRETGLALDRAGARLRGEYAFLEERKILLKDCPAGQP
jgi:hypothetical protein